MYLHQELDLCVPVVKGYWLALNHVFSLTGMDLASSPVVLRICSDRILTCRINSICSPAKVGLVVTDFNYQPGS